MKVYRAEMTKVKAVDAGNETQFYEAVLVYREQLYGIAFSYLRNHNDALEAIQEMTCRAWIKRKTLKNPNAFKSWIIRILIFICIDEQRRRKRTVPLASEDMDGVVTEIRYSRLEMLSALEGVKLKYRHVLLLKYYNDLTLAEIAVVLKKPEGTVKTWQHKGLVELRAIIKNRGEWNND